MPSLKTEMFVTLKGQQQVVIGRKRSREQSEKQVMGNISVHTSRAKETEQNKRRVIPSSISLSSTSSSIAPTDNTSRNIMQRTFISQTSVAKQIAPCPPAPDNVKLIWRSITQAAMSGNIEMIDDKVREIMTSVDGSTISSNNIKTKSKSKTKTKQQQQQQQRTCTREAAIQVRRCMDWVCRTPIKLSTSTHVNMDVSMTGTPLIFAALRGVKDSCAKLLSCGASIDVCNINGDTALMCAAYFGHVDVVEVLLQHGASTACSSQDGATALMYAVESGNFQTVKMLVEMGNANLYASDMDGHTVMMIAASSGGLLHVKDILEYLESRTQSKESNDEN